MTESEFRTHVEQFVKDHGTQWKAAHTIGISHAYLSYFLRGKQPAGPKIASYFGLVPVVTKVKPVVRYEAMEERRTS